MQLLSKSHFKEPATQKKNKTKQKWKHFYLNIKPSPLIAVTTDGPQLYEPIIKSPAWLIIQTSRLLINEPFVSMFQLVYSNLVFLSIQTLHIYIKFHQWRNLGGVQMFCCAIKKPNGKCKGQQFSKVQKLLQFWGMWKCGKH